jgi:N-acetylglutamate synthase-like GNAT family acetyltransferase
VAVSPSYRGRGLVQFLVGLLPIVARLFRLDHMTLISVNQTEVFWRKLGFSDTLDSELQRRVRAKYSAEAVHMEKTIDAHF